MVKYTCNLVDDGLVGQQLFAGEATRLAYATDEAVEGRDAFVEKRINFSKFPWHFRLVPSGYVSRLRARTVVYPGLPKRLRRQRGGSSYKVVNNEVVNR